MQNLAEPILDWLNIKTGRASLGSLNNTMLMKVINRLEDERAKLDLGRQGEAWTPPHTTPLKMRTTLSLLKIE